MKKIGIMGGTFDPPHVGHMMIAEEVRVALNLDEIWFIPTFTPPHKEEAQTSANHRLAMLELALNSNEHFKVNAIELDQECVSYTIDTINQFKLQYSDYDFYFIIGADMVEYLPHWYKIDDLIKKLTFVGVPRPQYILETNYPLIKIETPTIDISSSLIRERMGKNKPVKYYLNEAVYAYIKEHKLYE